MRSGPPGGSAAQFVWLTWPGPALVVICGDTNDHGARLPSARVAAGRAWSRVPAAGPGADPHTRAAAASTPTAGGPGPARPPWCGWLPARCAPPPPAGAAPSGAVIAPP